MSSRALLACQGGKLDDITVVAAVVVDAARGAAALAASGAAAAAAVVAVPSAVGDAAAEGRDVMLGTTEQDEADALAKRLEQTAAAKQAPFAGAYSEQQVIKMDAAEARRALAAAGLPTSGKLEALRARLLTVSK